jgi:hypothetical protein
LPTDTKKKTYSCAFCSKVLRDAHEWRRHEVTHLPEMWICMPDNTPYIDERCAFCGATDPKLSHFKSHHNVNTCCQAPALQRCFVRRDQLQNHIARVHLHSSPSSSPRRSVTPNQTDLLNHWHREPDLVTYKPDALWCGFCQTMFPSWSLRVEHVQNHFRNGDDFSQWTQTPLT